MQVLSYFPNSINLYLLGGSHPKNNRHHSQKPPISAHSIVYWENTLLVYIMQCKTTEIILGYTGSSPPYHAMLYLEQPFLPRYVIPGESLPYHAMLY